MLHLFFLRRRVILIREIPMKTAADEVKVRRREESFLFLSKPRRFDSSVERNRREDSCGAADGAWAREPSISAADKGGAL